MLPDYLEPELEIVFVGINPGEYSDRVGHYFARKQNLFWSVLYRSRLVPVPLTPEDDCRMPQFGYGLTDIVKRATRNASHVTGSEFVEGARVLREKVERLEPNLVCFVGLVGYRQAVDRRAALGLQSVCWGTSRLFIVPSTSPRNVRYRKETLDWFLRLKDYMDELKSEGQTQVLTSSKRISGRGS
jgi:TDG/mug DNA glycosylase family protein